MLASMKIALHLALVCLVVGGGCGGSTNLRNSSVGAPTRPEDTADEPLGQAPDSLFSDTEWLLDSLGVGIDSLTSPGAFATDLPDLSDSLAAATEVHLPSGDEIFDYPVVVNRRVLAWIDLYRGRAKETFNRSLQRSGRYLAMARRIFAEEGIPQDLAFLAHVESGFRHNARSPVRALGLWQFMRGTARLYGLRCDSYVDERLDPEKATRAAARHLHDLYERYDDWYLSLAAYNAGAGKVDRAIRRSGSRDFWRIARTRYLRNETRNFVPAILAVTILAKSPAAYGFTEETKPPLEYDTVTVDTPTDLRVVARSLDVAVSEVQDLNPALLVMQTPPNDSSYEIRVPQDRAEDFAREFAKVPVDQRLVFHQHKVRRGQTLGLLARRYGTSVRAIQDANGMGRKTMIRIGQTLRIPTRSIILSDREREHAVKHTVRRGEFMARIASRYGVTIKEIQEANGIRNPSRIYEGQELLIPATKPASPEALLAERDTGESAAGHRGLRAFNTSDALGRVPTTAHIVEQAREAIKRERELGIVSPVDAPRVHVVRRGDTLSEIAELYGIGLSQLRRWNGLGRRSLIHPRQELLVSDPMLEGGMSDRAPQRTHIVRRGESLWTIAKRYGVRIADLTSWNQLRRSATIYPGQKLRLY